MLGHAWLAVQGSSRVFINGRALVRKEDHTLHCMHSMGQMLEGSGDVIDNSPPGAPLLFAILQVLLDLLNLASVPPHSSSPDYNPDLTPLMVHLYQRRP